jgi:hypothetical protein
MLSSEHTAFIIYMEHTVFKIFMEQNVLNISMLSTLCSTYPC